MALQCQQSGNLPFAGFYRTEFATLLPDRVLPDRVLPDGSLHSRPKHFFAGDSVKHCNSVRQKAKKISFIILDFLKKMNII
ncbi:Uncharacterized protein dnm_057910 [Desulfonema magnum]|uniref:Uncharacterized protein n=1 Tax=Desulfonema magnum TaxID=45655 RepID=A0A975BQ02_9BACT|nr:Uncharacterized protein dnm_057910 [Desulfonema magnum]